MLIVTPQCSLIIDYIGSSKEVREFECQFRKIELEESVHSSGGHELTESLPPGTDVCQERDHVHMQHIFIARLEQLANLSKRVNEEILKKPART